MAVEHATISVPVPVADMPGRAAAVRDAARWFALAVGSLAVAGLFSLVLVVGRVPVIASILVPDVAFAHRSLVVHVNLAMGVWFFSCLAGLFCLLPGSRRVRTAPLAVLLATLGVVALSIPMFFPSATPVLSNYIPALDHGLFLAGLALFAGGVMLNFADARVLSAAATHAGIPADAQHGVRAAAAAFFIAMLTLAGAYFTLDVGLTAHTYFERLFWGGGHVLQTANTLGMLAAWLILLHRLTGRVTVAPRLAAVLFALMLLPVLPGPWLTFGGHSGRWFTRMMQYGIFPVVLVVLGFGIAGLWRFRASLAPGACRGLAFVGLSTSVVMTLAGFVLGAMIAADTTLIPAHYHANIGAVTVAYMTVLIVLLPRLGAAVPWPRLATWQPLLYGVGQMVFVLGLAVAGTLGQASRKTYGQEQHLETQAELVGLMIVGMGGVIALGGGVFFIAIMVQAARKACRRQSAHAA